MFEKVLASWVGISLYMQMRMPRALTIFFFYTTHAVAQVHIRYTTSSTIRMTRCLSFANKIHYLSAQSLMQRICDKLTYPWQRSKRVACYLKAGGRILSVRGLFAQWHDAIKSQYRWRWKLRICCIVPNIINVNAMTTARWFLMFRFYYVSHAMKR